MTHTTAPQGAPILTKHDEAHRNVIGRAAKERAAEAERLAAELAAVKAAAAAARRQYAGASSRRKVVEDEVCTRVGSCQLCSMRAKMIAGCTQTSPLYTLCASPHNVFAHKHKPHSCWR